MEKKFRSIVDELIDLAPHQHQEAFIESRGAQVIASATHLLRLVRESFGAEISDDLTKRLLRAIASGDPEKFSRKLRSLRESREKKETDL